MVTILITPLAFQAVTPLYRRLRERRKTVVYQTFALPAGGLHDHVIIAGAGRVGQYVAQVLQRLDLAFVAVELDQNRVEECKAAGIPVIYGDAAQEPVLAAAGLASARLILITTPAITMTRAVVAQVRHLRPDLHIVARAEGVEPLAALHELGVYEVVQPEFEAALEVLRQALLHLNHTPDEIQRFTDAVRLERYAPLYADRPDYATVARLQSAHRLLAIEWFALAPDSPLAGRTLAQLDVRAQTGALVVAALREEQLLPNPDADHRFAPGDLVAVVGDGDQRAAFAHVANPSLR
jgi:CPA2 family monovalent cation:H+ antiporter-2